MGLSHGHDIPPLIHARATCANGVLDRLEEPTIEWRSTPTPGRRAGATFAGMIGLVDVVLDAPPDTLTRAIETWRWQRGHCWPPPWESDPGAVGHERARLTYAEAERRADFLEIAASHPGYIGDVAVPILERFQEEAAGEPQWDPEIIALQIAQWQHHDGETIEDGSARYAHEAELLGLPAQCGLDDVTHINNMLPGPGYGVRVVDVRGEAGLRELLDYFCSVGASGMSITAQ